MRLKKKSIEKYKLIIKRSEKWKDRNENTILNIFDAISDTVRKEIGPKRNANIIWIRLINLYKTTKVPEINRLISSIFEIFIEKYNYCGGDGCTVCVCDYHAKKGCAARVLNNQIKHDSLSVIISRTRQISSVINKAIS
jgi:hypothetical protein